MKKAIAMKWAEDLRANYKKKGVGSLLVKGFDGDKDKYCCLGRLCVVLGYNFGYDEDTGYTTLLDKKGNEVEKSDLTVLPGFIQDKVGMISEDGELNIIDEDHKLYGKSLVDLNDDDEKGFKYIANIIEKHYKDL